MARIKRFCTIGDERYLVFVSVGELPAVTKPAMYYSTPLVIGGADGSGTDVLSFPMTAFTKHSVGGNVKVSFGSGEYHSNITPCIAVYGWKRTA